jgi:tetratricopeptide (TPR) repeat protein
LEFFSSSELKPRMLELIGRAYGRLGIREIDHKERHKFLDLALQNLLLAFEADPHDYWISFHLAFHYAFTRDISNALKYVKNSLNLYVKHTESLHLLTLLLSSIKDFSEALVTIDMALDFSCYQDFR